MTSEGEASDKCEEESEAGGGARGEIEIDISSLESNSEVSRLGNYSLRFYRQRRNHNVVMAFAYNI